jgi:CRP-like cAMP-binding protein
VKKIDISDLKLLEILNRVPFFKDFTVSERKAFFASSLTFMQCKENRNIIKKGDKETNFYIILSGHASVSLNNNLEEVALLDAGYFIGEGAFVMNRPRTATVLAKTDVLLLCLDQKSLRRFPASIREKIKDQIIEGMAMRLSDMNHRFLHSH